MVLGLLGLAWGPSAAFADPLAGSSTTATLSADLATLSATTATSFLSEEELALMREIEAGSATVALAALEVPLDLDLYAPGASAIPRTVGELLSREPLLLDARRRFRSNDELVLRGRAGGRVELSFDGLLLENALTRADQRDDLGLLPASRIESATIDRLGSSVHLFSRSPALGRHVRTDVAAVGRSADRSSAVDLAAEGGLEAIAARLYASYADFEELRLGGRSGRDVGSFERLNLGARVRALGRDDDPLQVDAGASLDRLTNVLRRDHAGAPWVDREAFRRAVFLHAAVKDSFDLVAGFDSYRRDRTAIGSHEVSSRSVADTVQLALSAHLELAPALTIGLRSRFAHSAAEEGAAQGETQQLLAAATVDLSLDPLELGLEGGLNWARSALDAGVNPSAALGLGPYASARALLELGGGFGLDGGFLWSGRLPSFGDRLVLLGDPRYEQQLSGELGLHWRRSFVALSVLGFLRREENSLEPRGDGLVTLEEVSLAGVEARLEWVPVERLSLRGSGAFTRAMGVPLAGVPGLLLQGSLHYDFGVHGAFVELLARGHVGERLTPHDVGALGAQTSEWSTATVGVELGAELGAGFSAVVVVENLFDAPTRSLGSLVAGPGLDLRFALSHRFE